MNRYSLYCTEAQTRKALELGAPILRHNNAFTTNSIPHFTEEKEGDDWTLYIIPTSEQMLAWLENKDIFVNFAHTSLGYDSWIKRRSDNELLSKSLGFVPSRREATLAAIDAALDYLLKQKGDQQ